MTTKRVHVYIRNEDILKKFKAEEEKSEIINTLLEDYYSQDLEYLRQKKQELKEEQKVIDMRINHKEKQNELIRKQAEEEELRKQELQDKKDFNEKLLSLWREEKISEKIYFKICDIKDLNKKKKELKKHVNN